MLIQAIAPELRRKIVGAIINRRRRALGMTLDTLARQVGLKTRQFVIAIEQGNRPIPTDKVDLFFSALKFSTTDMHVIMALSYPALWETILLIYQRNVSRDWSRTIEAECFQAIREYREKLR